MSLGARDRYLCVERSRRGHGSRGEDLDYRTGQGSFWLRQRTSYGDQGMFPALLQQSTPGLRLARTKLLMKWIMSSSGYCAPIYAGKLTGGASGKKLDELSQSVDDGINSLTL